VAARLLDAVTMMVYRPVLPAVGVPAMVAVPFSLLVKVSPVGSSPVSDMAGAGYPVAVMTRLTAGPGLGSDGSGLLQCRGPGDGEGEGLGGGA
jgi:hypothetical protein